jgi:hypothetical protein
VISARAGRACRFTVGVAFLVLAGASPVWADYRDTFRRAILAFRAEDWNTAAALFSQARLERSDESGRVQISGNSSEPYVPSFFLAQALVRLKRCPDALAAFDLASKRGSADPGLLRQIASKRRDCEQSQQPPPLRAASIGVAENAVTEVKASVQRASEAIAKLPRATSATFSGDVQNLQKAALDLESKFLSAKAAGDEQTFRAVADSASILRSDANRLRTRAEEAATAALLSRAVAAARRDVEETDKTLNDPSLTQSAPKEIEQFQSRLRALSSQVSEAERLGRVDLIEQAAAAAREMRSDITKLSATVAARGVAFAKAISEAEAAVATTTRLLATAIAIIGETTSNADVARAKARLEDAQRTLHLARGGRAIADAEKAKAVAEAAAQDLLFAQASHALSSASSRVTSLASQVASSNGSDALRARMTSLKQQVSVASRELEAARSRTEAAVAQKVEITARQILAQADSVDALLQSSTAAAVVPDEIRAAINAYFRGDYEQSVRLFDTLSVENASVDKRPRIYVVKAAALFGWYVRTGETNTALRRRAIEALQVVRASGQLIAPDQRFFSPRFVAFSQTVE